MRTAFYLRALLLVVPLCGCATHAEVVDLKAELTRLQEEVRATHAQSTATEVQMQSLDLRSEVHAYLQRDPLLAKGGHFPSLEERIQVTAHSFTFLLPSDLGAGAVRALYFKPDITLRLEFDAGVLPTDDQPNRLEVSTRNESFRPLNLPENPQSSFQLEEGQSLLLHTAHL